MGWKIFYNYVHPNKEKRHQLGYQVGSKSLVSEENSNVFDQLAIRSEYDNEGITSANVTITLKQRAPGFNQTQSNSHYQKTFLPKKQGGIEAQINEGLEN